jgi:hypothetical protein
MFIVLGLLDPDPLVEGMDPDPDHNSLTFFIHTLKLKSPVKNQKTVHNQMSKSSLKIREKLYVLPEP